MARSEILNKKLFEATPAMKRQTTKDLIGIVPSLALSGAIALLAFNGYHDGALIANNIASNIPHDFPLLGFLHGVNFDGPVQGLASLAHHIPGADALATAIQGKQQESVPRINDLIDKNAILAAEAATVATLPVKLVGVATNSAKRTALHAHQEAERLQYAGRGDEVPDAVKQLIHKAAKSSERAHKLGVALTWAEILVESAGSIVSEGPYGPNDGIAIGQAILGVHPLVGKLKFKDRMALILGAALPVVPADGVFMAYAHATHRTDPENLLHGQLARKGIPGLTTKKR